MMSDQDFSPINSSGDLPRESNTPENSKIRAELRVRLGAEMLEGLFSPLHLLVVVLVALVVFGLPLLVLILLAQWLDRRLQTRPGVRVSVIGVVIGGITDVVSSAILAIPLVIYVMVKFDLSHAPGGSTAITSTIRSTSWLYGLDLAIGLVCSVLGGYVAAWIAKHDELLNGLLSSFLCTAIGLYTLSAGKDWKSVPVQIFFLTAVPLSALLGGYLRHSQKRVRRAVA